MLFRFKDRPKLNEYRLSFSNAQRYHQKPAEDFSYSQPHTSTPFFVVMTPEQLDNVVQAAKCRVFNWQDAGNESHRIAVASLVQTLDDETASILCEPSLVRSSMRPPDIVLISAVGGVHVVEVKGIGLDDVQAVEPGGQFSVQYASGARSKNPFFQVRSAMFDIKNAAERMLGQSLVIPFQYWVVLPRISRIAWQERWGRAAILPEELLFQDDLWDLGNRFVEFGRARLRNHGVACWPMNELEAISSAFGDSSVLFPAQAEREARRVQEATLGEMFDEAAEGYKTLSDEQQRLSSQFWEKGPRLIRGVAGSGKTVVLANNLARRIERQQKVQPVLFDKSETGTPRILAVCFNRTLVPFLRNKIDIAYRQRTGQSLPAGSVDVFTFNSLMWHVSQGGVWRYRKIDSTPAEERAKDYLAELQHVKQQEPARFQNIAYGAIYVDEGQDFAEEEIRLLSELCNLHDGEPSLFVFYDDAQSLYGRNRPSWLSLGLNVLGGRSHVMTECFRNTRQIIEPAFNVLYGVHATDKAMVPTKAFGDVSTLEEKGLLAYLDGSWSISFARRQGLVPKVSVVANPLAENEFVVSRLRWLIQDQQVRPQDLLVLSYDRGRATDIARFVQKAKISGLDGVRLAFEEKDTQLCQRGIVTFSTVASAKGYDAFGVLLVSADDFPVDVQGRASFYVGCTRAIEYLEVTGASPSGLLSEMQLACR